jgi:hypothetical protein
MPLGFYVRASVISLATLIHFLRNIRLKRTELPVSASTSRIWLIERGPVVFLNDSLVVVMSWHICLKSRKVERIFIHLSYTCKDMPIWWLSHSPQGSVVMAMSLGQRFATMCLWKTTSYVHEKGESASLSRKLLFRQKWWVKYYVKVKARAKV